MMSKTKPAPQTQGTARARRGKGVTSSRSASFTVPALSTNEGSDVAALLQSRLVSLLDLGLTLKHIHWNVVGPNFISVHQMLDPQHDGVGQMADDVAERIATLGSVPSGLPQRIVDQRTWNDYDLDRADAMSHLGALDLVYQNVIISQRQAIDALDQVDPVSQDLLVGQAGVLERYHWFVRSHLTDFAGGMANAGASTELGAARAVASKSSRNATRAAKA